MTPVEVAVLGVLFIVCITISVIVTLSLLLPTTVPAVRYPLCEREAWP